jgi:hypothetical protein
MFYTLDLCHPHVELVIEVISITIKDKTHILGKKKETFTNLWDKCPCSASTSPLPFGPPSCPTRLYYLYRMRWDCMKGNIL